VPRPSALVALAKDSAAGVRATAAAANLQLPSIRAGSLAGRSKWGGGQPEISAQKRAAKRGNLWPPPPPYPPNSIWNQLDFVWSHKFRHTLGRLLRANKSLRLASRVALSSSRAGRQDWRQRSAHPLPSDGRCHSKAAEANNHRLVLFHSNGLDSRPPRAQTWATGHHQPSHVCATKQASSRPHLAPTFDHSELGDRKLCS